MDDDTRELLTDAKRDIDDAADEISDAVERLKAGESTASESLLGEAHTRLKLLSRRLEKGALED